MRCNPVINTSDSSSPMARTYREPHTGPFVPGSMVFAVILSINTIDMAAGSANTNTDAICVLISGRSERLTMTPDLALIKPLSPQCIGCRAA